MGYKQNVAEIFLLLAALVGALFWFLWEWLIMSVYSGQGQTKTACEAMIGLAALLVCPLGTQEVLRATTSWGRSLRRDCCDPSYENYQLEVDLYTSLCQSTKCSMSNSTNACLSSYDYYTNNGKTMGQCQSAFHRAFKGENGFLEGNLLCGVETYSGGSTCDRELGGGVICKGRNGSEILCGVQVFRYCESSIPNLFLKIGMYADWISKSMAELSKPFY